MEASEQIAIPNRDNPSAAGRQTSVAVTVRLDAELYERLKRFGIAHRLTNQRILVRALDQALAPRSQMPVA